MSDVPLLGQNPAPEEEAKPVKVRTAYVVFQDDNGQWGASNDPKLLADHLEISKIAHPDEMYAGAACIQSDVIAQKSAAISEQRMMVRAQAMQQQAADAALRQKLKV